MFTSQAQNSKTKPLETKDILEKQGKISPNVNLSDVKKFLTLVVEGEQDQAEAMLKSNPDLALVSGDVTDLSKRTFNNITGFQYAVWALDWHMWTMIKKYLSDECARLQAQGFETGSWVKSHGVHANLNVLIRAYQTTIDLYNAGKYLEGDKAWIQQVGGVQLLLPAHVINEYCHPTRSFSPLPNFRDAAPLPRTRRVDEGEWFTAQYNGGKLGDKFAIYRGNSRRCGSEDGIARGRTSIGSMGEGGTVWPDGNVRCSYRSVSCDRESVRGLHDTRAAQREELITQLKPRMPREISVQPQPSTIAFQDSSPITSTNSLLQSLIQLTKEKNESSTSSLSGTQHIQTNIQILDALVHDLQETEKEKQELGTNPQELEIQSNHFQKALKNDIDLQKFECTVLREKQENFKKQIDNLKESLSKASGIEQQKIQTNLQTLQEQLLDVQTKQDILWNEYEIKAQKREALKRFKRHPNLLLFYRTVHIKLEEIFISFKAIAGGFVNPVDGKVAIAKSIFDSLGDAASIAPIIGTAIEKSLKWSVSKGLEKLDSTRQKNIAKNASELVTLSEVKKYAESIARQLTERYADQLQLLATPEQEKAEAHKLKQALTKMKEVALKNSYAPPAKQLAAFGVLWITDQLCDATAIDTSKELDEALLLMISQKTPPYKLKEFWQTITTKLRIEEIHSKSGETWHPEAVYTLPGIRTTDNEYYSAETLQPLRYGWRLGTAQEAAALSLKQVAAPTTQVFVLEHRKVVKSISIVNNAVKEIKDELEKRGRTEDIAGGARFRALQQENEELKKRMERLEVSIAAASSPSKRRGSSIIDVTDKKDEKEKLRHVVEELITFFLEERAEGEKTENYAIYNEYLKKLNNGAKLLYMVQQKKHILYVNNQPIEDINIAIQEIMKMLESLGNVHSKPVVHLSPPSTVPNSPTQNNPPMLTQFNQPTPLTQAPLLANRIRF